ncbi:hypothetical protein Agub_g8665 [Astrephomene gubernaculifera]|uniref:Uncharacterized protein n=1 Tax=Astrephomene gubernaculifera TaxID=47775 RepID=A0AAD3DS73_9CHLO|nr:hypothetical protein Agub_g8665 [Astrephomene gubernaculifera]
MQAGVFSSPKRVPLLSPPLACVSPQARPCLTSGRSEGSPWRSSTAYIRPELKAEAAHAHGQPFTGVVDQAPSISNAATTSPFSAATQRAPGNNNSGFVQEGHVPTPNPGAETGASQDVLSSAAQALMRRLQTTLDGMGSSIAQILFDGTAENWSGWEAGQLVTVLMTLGLLRRRPNGEWLESYFSASQRKLKDCTTTDLEMLSVALNSLKIAAPQCWRKELCSVALERAQASLAGASTAATEPPATSSFGTCAPENQQDLGNAAAAKCSNTIDGGGGTTERLLGPGMVLWRLMRRASASASAAWSRSRSSGELVSMLHHLVTARAPLEGQWFNGFLEAMVPRLADLSGGDLSTLLAAVVTASSSNYSDGAPEKWNAYNSMYDYYCGWDYGPRLSVQLSPGWQAALYARMDGINWALQGHTLVACLDSIFMLGLRPPPQWVRRQLLSLQPSLPLLQVQHLVRLADLLLAMPLQAAVPAPPGNPAAALAPGPWLPQPRPQPHGHLLQASSAPPGLEREVVAAAGSQGSGNGGRAESEEQQHWLESWMDDYRAVVSEYQDGMSVANLLAILAAADAVAAASSAPATVTATGGTVAPQAEAPAPESSSASKPAVMTATAVAPRHYNFASVMSYGSSSDEDHLPADTDMPLPYVEWRSAMVTAVTERLPGLSVRELSDAWRALAVARSMGVADCVFQQPQQQQQEWQQEEEQQQQQPGQHENVQCAAVAGATAATVGLGDLRQLVAERMVLNRTRLSALEVAPVFSTLAASGLPPPTATLDALLAASQPLLPELATADIVTVVQSLAQVPYKPNLAWQPAFFAASRAKMHDMQPRALYTLLTSSVSLGMHVPDVWVQEFFTTPIWRELEGTELANVLWAVSCVASEAPKWWFQSWENETVRELGTMEPDVLVMVLKAMSTLHHKPCQLWQAAFFGAIRRRLFKPEAAKLRWTTTVGPVASNAAATATVATCATTEPGTAAVDLSEDRQAAAAWQQQLDHLSASAPSASLAAGGAAPSSSTHVDMRTASTTSPATITTTNNNSNNNNTNTTAGSVAAAASAEASAVDGSSSTEATTAAATSTTAFSSSSAAHGSLPVSRSGTTTETNNQPQYSALLAPTFTAAALNSLVYSLAALDMDPPSEWLDELMDAVRCKLSLLSTLDMSVVLAYLVARKHRPSDDWWESFLESLESRFSSLSAVELSTLLVMLHALQVSPAAQWLDAFCAATQPRLVCFQPSQLLQVLSCLHLFRHRPSQSWLASYTAAVEAQLPRLAPAELARVLMLLNNLNQRPSAAFMLRFFDVSRPGMALLDTQELVNAAWAVVSCSVVTPDYRWMDALVEAARPRLASLQQPQLRVLIASLGHMHRGVPNATAENFLVLAKEFLM